MQPISSITSDFAGISLDTRQDYINGIQKSLENRDYKRAFDVLLQCKEKGIKIGNLKLYNSWINAFAEAGEEHGTFTAFGMLSAEYRVANKEELRPNTFTFAALLKFHSWNRDLKQVFEYLELFPKAYGVKPDGYICQIVMEACEKAGDSDRAKQLNLYMKAQGIEANGKVQAALRRIRKLEIQQEAIGRGMVVPGDFLVIKPNYDAFKQISKIQQFVTDRFKEEGILTTEKGGTWAVTDSEFAHITLFTGFSKPLNEKEKWLLRSEFSDAAKEISAFALEIDLSAKTTFISRGPRKWVTLQFAGPEVTKLKEKVNRIVQNVRELAKKDPTSYPTLVRIEDDDLDKKFTPHITLGTLDIGAKVTHPDVKQLEKGSAIAEFDRAFEAEQQKGLKNSFVKMNVHQVTLLQTANLYASAKDRKYSLVSEYGFGSLYDTSTKFTLSKLARVFNGLGDLESLDIEPSFDDEGKPTIDMLFSKKDEKIIGEFCKKIGATPRDIPGTNKFYIRLGEKRCIAILGEEQGKLVYQKLSTLSN